MVYFKHVHAVKAGKQTLVTLIIGGGMQHLVVYHLVVVAVQHLAQQIEFRFQAVRKRTQPSHKIMIQTIGHVQTQAVNVKLFHPALHTVQNMIDHVLVSQI